MSTSTPTSVTDGLSNLPQRIKASAERLSGLAESVRKERQQRDELIVEYVDHAGGQPAQAARAAGITQTQVLRILSGSSED